VRRTALLIMSLAVLVGAFGVAPAGAQTPDTAGDDLGQAPLEVVTESYEMGAGPWRVQRLTVSAFAGSYRLQYEETATATLNADAPACWAAAPSVDGCAPDSLQAALVAIGVDAVVTDGPHPIDAEVTESEPAPAPAVRYTITFASPDPSPLAIVDVAWGTVGQVASIDCVFCVDTEAGTIPNANGAAVIYVHGGAFISGSRTGEGWPDARARLQAAGYRTFTINYRLLNPPAAMFGPQPFGSACDWSAPTNNDTCRAWLAAADDAAEDVNRAVRWLRAVAPEQGIDPNRIAVLGSSAGAIAALHNHYAPVDDEGQAAATVSLSGIMDTDRQDRAAGPVLLVSFAGVDPVFAGEFLESIDVQARNEDILATGAAYGNKVHLRSYPGRGHQITSASPYFEDLMRTTIAFLDESLRSSATRGVLGGMWMGTTQGFDLGRGQSAGHAPGSPPRPVTGDFNGDAKQDVIWHATDGQADMVWYGSADGVWRDPIEWHDDASSYEATIVAPGGDPAVVGDFNGDGRTDVLWYDPSSGHAAISNGELGTGFTLTTIASMSPGLSLTRANLDGDRLDDLVVHDATTGTASLLRSTGAGSFSATFSSAPIAPEATAVVADFDGDGDDDVHWHHQPEGSLWLGDGKGGASRQDGPTAGSGHVPTPADLNGDDAADIVWYDPATGADTSVWVGRPDGVFAVAQLGNIPFGLRWFAEDINADEKVDLIAYAPAMRGAAAFLNDGTGLFGLAFFDQDLPASAPEPVFADLNGDGHTDVTWAF